MEVLVAVLFLDLLRLYIQEVNTLLQGQRDYDSNLYLNLETILLAN